MTDIRAMDERSWCESRVDETRNSTPPRTRQRDDRVTGAAIVSRHV